MQRAPRRIKMQEREREMDIEYKDANANRHETECLSDFLFFFRLFFLFFFSLFENATARPLGRSPHPSITHAITLPTARGAPARQPQLDLPHLRVGADLVCGIRQRPVARGLGLALEGPVRGTGQRAHGRRRVILKQRERGGRMSMAFSPP